MYRLLYIILFFSFLSGILFCDELSEYTIYKIKDIPSGKEKGLIGWEPAVAGGFSGPTSFAVSFDRIYIPDSANYRINVYDTDFNFIKEIVEEGKNAIPFSTKMKVDKNDNIVSYIQGFGLKKINTIGEVIFFIPYNALPKQVTQYRNFFPLNDEVFIYNDEGEVEYIDNTGKVVSVNKAISKLQEIAKNNKQLKNTLLQVIKVPDDKMQIIETLRNSKKYILVDDEFYSTDFHKNREYFDKIKDIREYVKSENAKVRSDEEKNEINLNIEDFSIHFFDYDANHNSYWMGIIDKPNRTKKFAAIIYSKYGELLDAFYYGQYIDDEKPGLQPDYSLYPTSGAEVAVAPSGDVYFLVGSKEKYTLYKVERRW